MINAQLPNLPLANVDIEQAAPDIKKRDPRIFSTIWYRFLAKLVTYLKVLQESPQQIDQAALQAFTQKLGRDQIGLVVWIPAPYDHLLVWEGSAWNFAPGDAQSGFTVPFLIAPTGDGWALCNGATVPFLQANGTVAMQVLPTTAGLYFRQ